MNEEMLTILQRALVARRDELKRATQQSSRDRDAVALDQQSVGRVSRVDALQRQAMAKAQEHQRQKERMRIEAALRRIDEGEYGYCTECGEEIATKRLEADPAAVCCINCARGQS